MAVSGISPEDAVDGGAKMWRMGFVSLGTCCTILPGIPSPILPPALVPERNSRDLLLGFLFGQQRNLSPHGPTLIQIPALLYLASEFTVMNVYCRTQRPQGQSAKSTLLGLAFKTLHCANC